MRTVRYERYGEPSQVLDVVEVAEPGLPADGQLLVRVTARPLIHGLLSEVRGKYLPLGAPPALPVGGKQVGHEGVGVIVSGGSGTDGRFRVGQRVAFFPGTPSCAEYVLVDAEYATLVPDDMDDEVAAQLHVNPLTATMLLRAAEDSGAASGTRTPTVITAGGSTVSRMFAALASKKNVPVVSLVRRDSAVEALQQQLPECAVVSTEGASWKDELAAAVGENGIRVALDTVGGETGTDLLRMLAPGGALIVFGDLSGGLLQASALDFPIRGIQIFGVTLIDWPRLPTDVRASDVAGAVQLAQERPDLFSAAATYDLGDVREAALHAERPEKSGLVILRSDHPTGSLHTNHRT